MIIEVQDTGAGIAPAEMDKLFSAFEQTESGRNAQEGTGLGLFISRRLAELMCGGVTATSEVGQGSVFRVEVELEPGDAVNLVKASGTNRVVGLKGDSKKVLIVDDRATNRLLLSSLLQPVGFEVREAIDGQEAIEVFESWQPDLILMDISMPRVDGIEATKRIRKMEQGSVPILAVSASVQEGEQKTVLEAGANGFLAKPIRESDLFVAIAMMLVVPVKQIATYRVSVERG